MPSDDLVDQLPAPPAALELELVSWMAAFARAAIAPATLRRYEAAWRLFVWFCREIRAPELPATGRTLALYTSWLATRCARSTSTITVHVAAIGRAHELAGHRSPADDPHFRTVWRGTRRTIGRARHPKRAARLSEIVRLLEACDEDCYLMQLRNRAMILMGFAGGRRRSELTALDVGDVRLVAEGLEVTVRRGKTDQEGRGLVIGIPYGSRATRCPVRAHLEWIQATGLLSGALYRSISRHGALGPRLTSQSVSLVVKRLAERCGLPAPEFGGHSLRSGFCTTAADAGADDRDIMRQTGHTSRATVAGYVHAGTLFHNNAAKKLGL